jgi:hypothetical protein
MRCFVRSNTRQEQHEVKKLSFAVTRIPLPAPFDVRRFFVWEQSMSKRIFLITCAALNAFFLVCLKKASLHASEDLFSVSPADLKGRNW